MAVLFSLACTCSSFFKIEGFGARHWLLGASWFDGASWTVLECVDCSPLLAFGSWSEGCLSLLFPVDCCWLESPVLSSSDASRMTELVASGGLTTLSRCELNALDSGWDIRLTFALELALRPWEFPVVHAAPCLPITEIDAKYA